MHEGGRSKLESFKTDISRITYADTKLHVLILCKAVARKWTDVYANALNPVGFLQKWVAVEHLVI
jgi:hypothetical protein